MGRTRGGPEMNTLAVICQQLAGAMTTNVSQETARVIAGAWRGKKLATALKKKNSWREPETLWICYRRNKADGRGVMNQVPVGTNAKRGELRDGGVVSHKMREKKKRKGG